MFLDQMRGTHFEFRDLKAQIVLARAFGARGTERRKKETVREHIGLMRFRFTEMFSRNHDIFVLIYKFKSQIQNEAKRLRLRYEFKFMPRYRRILHMSHSTFFVTNSRKVR